MNNYNLSIVKVGRHYIFFNLYVNDILINIEGYMCMEKDAFENFYKDLFKASKGGCIKTYSKNPPVEFYS